MLRTLANIFWLGNKELRSVFSDVLMVAFIVWSFTFSIAERATGMGDTVNNASIAIVDEDRTALSRRLGNALYPPYFKRPDLIEADAIDRAMDQSRYMFVVVIPPRFEADLRQGRQPKLQLNIDATAVMQAGIGAGYIQNILTTEITRYLDRADQPSSSPVSVVQRRAFNPNGTQKWFAAIVALLDQLSMLTIVLTGAALLREREHGTIEHLLVLPLNAFEIAMAKVWANGLIILVAFTLSMVFVVGGVLDIPMAGSKILLLSGTMIYLFAAAAIGIFLGTIARTMAQFALLMMMTIMAMMMLSGGMSPIESQPAVIQPFTWLLPSRHYMAFAQAVVFRGAGIDIIWPEFITVAGLGFVFFAASLVLFRRSIARSQ
ncbi:ABC transporter permease [Hyphomicrobium sp.]|uniref:ABC transporter permease n=1 Tax=Hyphomicrobium sp. TaxID=82 RepID=UPI002FE3A6B9